MGTAKEANETGTTRQVPKRGIIRRFTDLIMRRPIALAALGFAIPFFFSSESSNHPELAAPSSPCTAPLCRVYCQ